MNLPSDTGSPPSTGVTRYEDMPQSRPRAAAALFRTRRTLKGTTPL